jgi:hypothetical protein
VRQSALATPVAGFQAFLSFGTSLMSYQVGSYTSVPYGSLLINPVKVTGSDMDMLRNWAFLVPRNSVKDFKTRIEHANTDHIEQGLFFQLSGPWPPYSFCVSLVI